MRAMDDLQEYHNMMLLASNFVVGPRPACPASNARELTRALSSLFEALDDDTYGLISNARTVGAGAPARVYVI